MSLLSDVFKKHFDTPEFREEHERAEARLKLLIDSEEGQAILAEQRLLYDEDAYLQSKGFASIFEDPLGICRLAGVDPTKVKSLRDLMEVAKEYYRSELMRVKITAAAAAEANPQSAASQPLDANTIKVLKALHEFHPKLLVSADIEAAASLSKQTVARVLDLLIARGLAHRPQGSRRGAACTAEGKAISERIS